jgi:hypothetical protein
MPNRGLALLIILVAAGCGEPTDEGGPPGVEQAVWAEQDELVGDLYDQGSSPLEASVVLTDLAQPERATVRIPAAGSCDRWELAGRWWLLSDRLGLLLGRMTSPAGERAGYLGGIWGTRRNGDQVFVARLVDEVGDPLGWLRGNWGGDSFWGGWMERTGEALGSVTGEFGDTRFHGELDSLQCSPAPGPGGPCDQHADPTSCNADDADHCRWIPETRPCPVREQVCPAGRCVVVDPSPSPGGSCSFAADCRGALPQICVASCSGGPGACAHWTCVADRCSVEICPR